LTFVRFPRAARVAACALALAMAPSPPARADGSADEAELHFNKGREDYKKGDYEAALLHFFQSQRLVPNRNVLFNIGGAYEALRRYADAHRYFIDAREGETDDDNRAAAQRAIDRLAPNVAVLDVVTEPPGATLYLERKDLGSVGKSPRPLAVAPGKYRVVVELAGHEPSTSAEVEVVQGKVTRLEVKLAKIVGTVRADVQGGIRALVRVDSERAAPACTTPCELPLAPGRHDLYFEADGFQLLSRAVVVEAKQTTTVTAALVPLIGSLLVRTEDRDATVAVDGKSVGFTPLVARDIAVGKRTVRIELRGYRPTTTTIEIRAGEQIEIVDVELDPLREVSAVSRTAESIDDAPSSVTILDRRELAAFGYPTIYEALRGVRGIALSNDRGYPAASVRGIGQPGDYGNRLLVLADGQPLNENVASSASIGADARTDLRDVERIEIARGPGSLLYGTGAFSGLVELVQRPPDAPNEVHAQAGVYDDEVAHARAGFHYNFGPGRSVWASVSAARSDGFDLAVPVTSAKPGNLPVAHRVDAFTSGGTAGRVTVGPLTAQWYYQQRTHEIPVGAYATLFDDPGTVYTDRRFMSEVRYEPQITKNLRVFARAHTNHYHSQEDYVTADGPGSEDYIGTWFGGEARVVYTPWEKLRLTLGGEAQYHPEASLLGESGPPGEETPYLEERHPYSSGAVYALAEGKPLSWLAFSAGARVDIYSTFGAVVVPRAALIFKPAPAHVLKVMGGRAFRAPSIFEQFYNDRGFSQVLAVDPSRNLRLEPESVYSGEVEYSLRFQKDWVALAAVHTSFIEGTIGLVPDTANSAIVRYENSQSPVLVAGGDLELRRERRRGLMLAASYGYQRAQTLDVPGNPLLPNAPEHLASVRAVVPVLKEIASLGLRATLEAPRRIRADSDATTDAAVVADATVSGSVPDTGIRYVMGVYNFADWHYETPVDATFASRTMPQNGRRFLLNVEWVWR